MIRTLLLFALFWGAIARAQDAGIEDAGVSSSEPSLMDQLDAAEIGRAHV